LDGFKDYIKIMIRLYTFLVLLFQNASIYHVALGQTVHQDNIQFPSGEFTVYHSFTDTLKEILYQIGRYEPRTSRFQQLANGEWREVPVEGGENLVHVHAPIYLKIKINNTVQFYFLDDYSDPDLYRVKKLNDSSLILVSSRYGFYVFDSVRNILSKKVIPGAGKYEGEDATSGLYAGVEVFDNDRFLLGNVKGYGVFCFDIKDLGRPIALQRHGKSEFGAGAFYIFFVAKAHELYDVILAQTDREALHPGILGFSIKLRQIRYIARDIKIEQNLSAGESVWQQGCWIYFRSDKGLHSIDLRSGNIQCII